MEQRKTFEEISAGDGCDDCGGGDDKKHLILEGDELINKLINRI
jgi:hypothetical protein